MSKLGQFESGCLSTLVRGANFNHATLVNHLKDAIDFKGALKTERGARIFTKRLSCVLGAVLVHCLRNDLKSREDGGLLHGEGGRGSGFGWGLDLCHDLPIAADPINLCALN